MFLSESVLVVVHSNESDTTFVLASRWSVGAAPTKAVDTNSDNVLSTYSAVVAVASQRVVYRTEYWAFFIA